VVEGVAARCRIAHDANTVMHANSAVAAIRVLSLLTSSLPDVVVAIGSVICTSTHQ
jgi:hypothetical protein